MDQVIHHCPVCNEKAEMRCVRCKGIFYCGATHQREHWVVHRQVCNAKTEKSAKSVLALLDIAAPMLVFGGTFGVVAVVVQEVQPSVVDGKTVRVVVTGPNTGRAITPSEFCPGNPELFFAMHSIGKGLAFALSFALSLLELVSSKSSDGRPVVLCFRDEIVESFGVVENVAVSSALPVIVFFDAEREQPYASSMSAGKEHGMTWIRMTSGKMFFIDFAAAQFSETAQLNGGPCFICERGSEQAKKLYGESDQAWQFIPSTSLGDSLKRLLEQGTGLGDLAKQVKQTLLHLVSALRPTFDLAK